MEQTYQTLNIDLLEKQKKPQGFNWLGTNFNSLIDIIEKDQNVNNALLAKYDPFLETYEQLLENSNKIIKSEGFSKLNLTDYIIRQTKKTYFQGFFFSILQETITILIIITLNQITDNLRKYSDELKFKLLFLFMVFIILGFLRSFARSQALLKNFQWNQQLQLSVQYLLFQKALRTKVFSKPNDGNTETPNVNTLLTSDINTMLIAYDVSQRFVLSITTTSILLFLLYLQLGSTIKQGLLLFMACFFFNGTMSYGIVYFYKRMLTIKDRRIELTKDVVEGMKSIKYLSWEKIFSGKILGIRKQEFVFVVLTRVSDCFVAVFWNSVSYILLYIFLTAYVQENDIENSNVFSIIVLFGYLTFPLGIIPFLISSTNKVFTSLHRLQLFLDESEITALPGQIKDDIEGPSSFEIQVDGLQATWPKSEQQLKSEQRTENSKNKNQNQSLSSAVEKSKEFILKINDLQINKSTLTFVVGNIGSGKSAFFQALLSEMDYPINTSTETKYSSKKSSFVEENPNSQLLRSFIGTQSELVSDLIICKGSVAYVSQNHWLQNKSIKENIIFGNNFNSVWYQTCVNASQLETDLNQFEEGDERIIGPKGANLSGGQQQRVALCRALYSKADIYLFDDIFSSIDAHVADKIFEEAIVNLLISEQKATILFITSQHKYIDYYQQRKIILVQEGVVTQDLNQINSFLFSNRDPKKDAIQERTKNSVNELQTNDLLGVKKLEKEKVNNEEQREKGEVTIATFVYYCRSMGFVFLFFYVSLNFLMQGTRNLIDFWLQDSVSKNTSRFDFINSHFDNNFSQTFKFLIILNLAVTSIRMVFYFICSTLASKRIFNRLNKQIVYSKMTFFDKNPIGRIISRISSDMLVVDDSLPWTFHVFLERSCYIVGYPLGILLQFPWMIIFVLLFVPALVKISKQYRICNREVKRLQLVNEGKVLTAIGEGVSGLQVIRSFQKQDYILEEYKVLIMQSLTAYIINQGLNLWMSVRSNLVSAVLSSLVCITASTMILFQIEFEYTKIAMALTYSALLVDSYYEFIQFYTRTEQQLISVERINQYTQNELEKPNFHSLQRESASQKSQLAFDSTIFQSETQYSIIFDKVCLKYNQGKNYIGLEGLQAQDQPFSLNNLSLSIKKGEKIAFCGRTGSGKTSILNVLFKLYEIDSGNVIINDQNINSISLLQLRNQISIIPQFGFLFKADLQNNLDPNKQLTQQQIETILLKSEMGTVFQSKDQTKDSLLTLPVQTSGQNLSNGEKQVINFLRILIKNSDIICLDEATSNMDPNTDRLLHQKLFEFVEGKTLIVITHRLENIEHYDRIVVMDNGQIKEIGSYNELKSKKDGFFEKLQIF